MRKMLLKSLYIHSYINKSLFGLPALSCTATLISVSNSNLPNLPECLLFAHTLKLCRYYCFGQSLSALGQYRSAQVALWERSAWANGERVTSWDSCNRIVCNMSHCDCHNLWLTPSEYTNMLQYFKGNLSFWVRQTLKDNNSPPCMILN